MNGSEWTLLAITLAFGIFLPWGFLFFLPSCMKSFYRYRLWRLRDQLYDEILRGDLPDDDVALEILRHYEALILHADEVKLPQLVTAVVAARQSGLLEDADDAWELGMSLLHEKHRKRLEWYQHQLVRATVVQLFRGSPSGWLATMIMLLTYGFMGLPRRIGLRDFARAKTEPIQKDLQHTEYLVPMWQRPNSAPRRLVRAVD